jgi:hypothetical protein
VLTGPVNAGKSTLFNVLVGRARAVVDPSAGTTRDIVHERVRLGAYPVELFDTAGRRALAGRAAEDELEREGQRRAEELARGAELVLELVPPGASPPTPVARVHCVASRADEGLADPSFPRLAAAVDPFAARAVVEQLFHAALDLPHEPWEAGVAVPFEPSWNQVLARAAGAELSSALERWLAAR